MVQPATPNRSKVKLSPQGSIRFFRDGLKGWLLEIHGMAVDFSFGRLNQAKERDKGGALNLTPAVWSQ